MIDKNKVAEVLKSYVPNANEAVIKAMADEITAELEEKSLAVIRERIKMGRNKVFADYTIFPH